MIVNPTYISVPDFGASADIVEPDSPNPYIDGYLPNQQWPAQHANFFLNGLTTNDNLGFTALQHVIAELGNVVTKSGASITPGDDTQVYTAVQNMAVKDVSYLLSNVGIDATVAASALTIALKQKDGSTNPAADSGKVEIAFRSSTLTTGGWVVRTVTGSLSTVISSGSTAGFTSGVADTIYVYAIDNAGTIELAWSTEDLWDEGLLWSTTAEGGAGAADSRVTLYSTTARSNVAIRLIGKLVLTEATAGTWATSPSSKSVTPFYSSGVTQANRLRSAASSLTTATALTIASFTPPAGEWDISGAIGFLPGASTSITDLAACVSLVTNTFPASDRRGNPLNGEIVQLNGYAAFVPGAVDTVIAIPSYRFKTDGSVVLYLVARATFTASTLTAYGFIQAIRARG
jgi:hypothetical protein